MAGFYQLMSVYLERILPMICSPGDDNREYGSSANADINVLQGNTDTFFNVHLEDMPYH